MGLPTAKLNESKLHKCCHFYNTSSRPCKYQLVFHATVCTGTYYTLIGVRNYEWKDTTSCIKKIVLESCRLVVIDIMQRLLCVCQKDVCVLSVLGTPLLMPFC